MSKSKRQKPDQCALTCGAPAQNLPQIPSGKLAFRFVRRPNRASAPPVKGVLVLTQITRKRKKHKKCEDCDFFCFPLKNSQNHRRGQPPHRHLPANWASYPQGFQLFGWNRGDSGRWNRALWRSWPVSLARLADKAASRRRK